MQSILGETSQVLNFDVRALYPWRHDLAGLQSNFTDSEIEAAIRGLASNKACGPDGLPNEFVKDFWPQLKGEISALMAAFCDHSLDLTAVNRANIIFIPKKEQAQKTSDYRLISVINLLPKIISKILANRLAKTLPDLISIQQTAFVKGHYIAENFLSTREIIHHLSAGGHEAVFAKVDFSKAFDSINWNFLIMVMEGRGFPPRWIRWISDILGTSSSRIVMNGERSAYFQHKRGLRQGDPLSPLLFILAVDVLQVMVSNVNSTLALDCPIKFLPQW